ncbi:MAG: hypothetical protein AAF892_06205 [Cyanobacteria bacterium P01_D01_bin.71]
MVVFPYTFKYLNHNKEPYPAIIFPAGASRVETNNDVFEFKTTGVYCNDLKTGKLERQDIASFMYPIPSRYFSGILANGFGLDTSQEVKVEFRKNIFPSFTYSKPPTASLNTENVKQTKNWLKERLSNQGCTEDFFVVRRELNSVNIKSKMISEVEVIDEERYDL